MKYFFLFIICICSSLTLKAEDGYKLWLRYDAVKNLQKLKAYRSNIKEIVVIGDSPAMSALKEELAIGLEGMLQQQITFTSKIHGDGAVVIASSSQALVSSLQLPEVKTLQPDGYVIKSIALDGKKVILITANNDNGLLYGAFNFLKLLQTNQDLNAVNISNAPKTKLRLLNHWDNLDRTVERGYAGFSLWDWHKLPDHIDPRYKDYARANASVGINGVVLTNVNANSLILTEMYLQKVKALAEVFRPYGIRVYLTARFNAPMELKQLNTADPKSAEVQQWWNKKAEEIYNHIPDFGGFLVKANSEGQPGPQYYKRDHADGANMLADAVAPFGGIVMWRAFVYDSEVPDDRAKQAYNEFQPLDGKFRKNVFVQVKNGAIDFQPREPFHPLFGAMPKTPLMMEFQITQEYLGFSTHLVYLSPLFKETLDADTYVKGEGSSVAEIVDGTLFSHSMSGMAGVANIGNDRNWCGHHFAQANWYAFGRLAWDHALTSEAIADEWIRMTFSNNPTFVKEIKDMMISSREAVVNYMTPLGLHHIMGYNFHYGPGPWVNQGRADWTSVYYHQADSLGVGFDRTSKGSNAVAQYSKEVANMFENPETCPEKYLLWFHHLPWSYKTKSGRTLWNELCFKYNAGVKGVEEMQRTWEQNKNEIDQERYEHVRSFLAIQQKEAVWWRDACLLYFQQFSRQPIPSEYPKPQHSLEYYQNLKFPYAPGSK